MPEVVVRVAEVDKANAACSGYLLVELSAKVVILRRLNKVIEAATNEIDF